MNIVEKLINAGKPEAEQETAREPNAPWDSYRYRRPSPRVARRQRVKDTLSADRRRRRASSRKQRTIQRVTEIEAVRRVRAWEHENVEAAVFHLMARGDYTLEDVANGIPIFDIADKLGLLTEVDE